MGDTMLYNQIFMLLIFVIGLILTSISWDIDSKLQDTDCKSVNLKTSNKLVLIIGVIFITSSLSFYGCYSRCENIMLGFNMLSYVMLLSLLGIVLIVLGSIISASSINSCQNNSYTESIWGLGLGIVLSCILYIYFQYKNNVKRI